MKILSSKGEQINKMKNHIKAKNLEARFSQSIPAMQK